RLEQLEVAPAALARLHDRWARQGLRARVYPVEVAGDPVKGRLGFDVAHDDQDRTLWPVVSPVEIRQVIDLDPRDIIAPAQNRVSVWMAQITHGQMSLLEPGLGRVELARPLLADDLALDFQFSSIEPRTAHPVCLDRQRQLPAIGRKREPVV